MSKKILDVVGLCGSLRATSINLMALRLASECTPNHMKLKVFEWYEVPPFDADLYSQGIPSSVLVLRKRLHEADAVLIASPEYNFSIPGMFKNALDWISRGEDQPLRRKPVAILSAAPGPVGGARMQYDLRKVLGFMDAMVMAKPEIFISHATNKFDVDGRCIDETTRRLVTNQMDALAAWTEDIQRISVLRT